MRRQFKPEFSAKGLEKNPVWIGFPPLVILQGLLLVLAAFWIFWPALHGAWLWDDGTYIRDNDLIHSSKGFWKVWVNRDGQGDYYPLTAFLEWGEWQLWGNATTGYHVVNVVLHLVSAFLLWRLFARLGFSLAWLGALIFVVHPLMVESVAWVSELKNTLALPPLLMAMLAWLDYDEKGEAQSYRSALLWFVLSMAAKTSGLMLPVVFLGYAWWKRGTIGWRDLKVAVPFLAVALAAGLITIMPHAHTKASDLDAPPWILLSGLATTGWTILFLLGKCFFPVGLLPDYLGEMVLAPTAFDFLPWAVLTGIALALVLGWRRMGWALPISLGLGFFLVNLIPVLIFVVKNYGIMVWSMDHLVYLPMIGLIGLAIAGLAWIDRRIPLRLRAVEWTAVGAAILAFAWGSHVYARNFAGPEIFWTYLSESEPRSWIGPFNLANYDLDQKRYPEAIDLLHQSLRLKPDFDDAYFTLGMALDKEGHSDEAQKQYLEAAKLSPHEAKVWLAMAEMMRKQKRYPEAEKFLEQARTADPNESATYAALAVLRVETGRTPEALDLYAKAVKMSPDKAQLRYNYGVALQETGHTQEAAEQLQASVDMDEHFAPSRENLGVALAQMGQLPDAIEQFQVALQIKPDYLAARDNLGLALAQTGHLEESIEQFQKALETDPKDAQARSSLAKLLAIQAAASAKP